MSSIIRLTRDQPGAAHQLLLQTPRDSIRWHYRCFDRPVTMRPHQHVCLAVRAADAKCGTVRIVIDDRSNPWLLQDRVCCLDNRPGADLSFTGDW